jgi:hypothetical protein
MPRLAPSLADLVPRPWDVFISYASEDKAWAERIAVVLREHGLRCWRDKDNLRLGEEFDERISDAIAKSRVVLLLISCTTVRKPYVAHEVTTARTLKRPIAPVFLERVPKDALVAPFDLKDIRSHCRWISENDEAVELKNIARDLRALTVRNRIQSWVILILLSALLGLVIFLSNVLVEHQKQITRLVALTQAQRHELIRAAPVFEPLLKRLEANATASDGPRPSMEFTVFGQPANTATEFVLDGKRSLRSGDYYRLEMVPRTGGWLYVFQLDAAGKIQWLYPANGNFTGSSGTNPVVTDSKILLPPQNAFGLDDVSGTEHLIAVFSTTRFEALEAQLAKISQDVSTPSQPLSPEAGKGLDILTKGSIGLVKPTAKLTAQSKAEGEQIINLLQAKGDLLVVHVSFEHLPR